MVVDHHPGERHAAGEPALLPRHRQLVRLAGVAARSLGDLGAARRPAQRPDVPAPDGTGAVARRHRARGPCAGHQLDRAAAAPGAACRAGRRSSAPRRRPCARLVRHHDLQLLRRAGVARLCGDDDRRAAAHRAQFRQDRARLRAAFRMAAVRAGARAARGLDRARILQRAVGDAWRDALGGGRGAAVGNGGHAVDAMDRLPEELPAGRAADPVENSRGRALRRAQRRRLGAARRAQLSCRHPHAALRAIESAALPAAHRAGQRAPRAGRAGSAMGQAGGRGPPRRQGRAPAPLPLPPMTTPPPTACPAWQQLGEEAARLRALSLSELFAQDRQRARDCTLAGAGLQLDFSRQRVDSRVLGLLVTLAAERGLPQWRAALYGGEPINVTEQRAVGHTALRAGDAAPGEVRATLARMRGLAQRLRGGGCWRRIVHLGTGGSVLGPQLVVDALGALDTDLEIAFAANIDPLDLGRALAGARPETTLFVVVSKTFTTEETLANARAARRWLGERDPASHFIAVTGNAPAARAFGAGEVLPLPDSIGGRFSLWSAVGLSALCAIGAERFDALLAGAREVDQHFAAAAPERNLPLLMALLGAWNVNFLGAATHAVLPYAHALRLLPAYLQQLEMESNGKCVDREGRALDYATAPVVWGAEGTVGQHSFHQLLHQGTQAVPADFIVAGVNAELDANAEAQADALAFGTADAPLPPYRRHPGNRPSSLIRLERIDALNLGRLLALYEHKVFAQGVIWNINSFDQWGVELGKALARRILSKGT
ncbi:MAG: glucose-6-phosphate isomerase [Betaproteobacteria bacterium]|nr:MAG: glucose-6-phosphate isomerase [Betaproteobacteria bacterium]